MRIIIIGAGKIAWHLAKRLSDRKTIVTQLYNRTLSHAERFHKELGIPITDKMDELCKDADLYILAVSDTSIQAVAQQLSTCDIKGLVVHTSGATPRTIIQSFFSQNGVFYPLQSFSSEVLPNWKQIPICIDAQKKKDLKLLEKLGKKIGHKVYIITDEQRSVLHIAAVFANNFTNHLLLVSAQILNSANVDKEILQPLIAETVRKANIISPRQAQTGPALRHDATTIHKHLHWLHNHPQWEQLYLAITDAIQKEHPKE